MMNRKVLLMFVAAGTLLTSACGGGEVVVIAALESDAATAGSPEAFPLAGLQVRLLPYDRDAIFDSLTQAAATPQPPIPDSLLALQTEIAKANEEWQDAEAQWNAVRDSLKSLADRMKEMSRSDTRYLVMFKDFQDLEPQEQAAKRASERAFARFTALQNRYNTQAEATRLAREAWADEAFASVDEVIRAKLEELGRQEVIDTTDANGMVSIKVKPGKWWVHARHPQPYDELYWNVPIEVKRGDPMPFRLSRENAQVRPNL